MNLTATTLCMAVLISGTAACSGKAIVDSGTAGAAGNFSACDPDLGDCSDSFENNETIDAAFKVVVPSQLNGQAVLSGLLNGIDDVDWFVVEVDEGAIAERPSLSLSGATSNTLVSVYFECLGGALQLSCPEGHAAISKEGRSGCSFGPVNSIQFEPSQIECSGASMLLFVQVEQTSDCCVDYQLAYVVVDA
ncbi:hypothetical protein JYT22_00315 [Endomicrobium sp. AH-315-J14]|nr:hypothetical protein [Endomicrobium sp. AH-315-J14]